MKHKFMSQDTLLIIFNVWMAAAMVLLFTGHMVGSMVCYAMMIVTTIQLFKASMKDRPTPPQPEKEDVK